MKRLVFWAMTVIAITAVGVAALLLRGGITARETPSAVEVFVARRIRHLMIPRTAREARNPTPVTPEVLAEGRAHFADHCATCHANDGGGDSEIGQKLYPRAPDMRKDDTQSLSDGELFYIIHNGVRYTGMPAWGGDGAEEDLDSWELVHFIRRLPKLTPEEIREMEKLNPRSPHELEEERASHGHHHH